MLIQGLERDLLLMHILLSRSCSESHLYPY